MPRKVTKFRKLYLDLKNCNQTLLTDFFQENDFTEMTNSST